jgi:hypothetical protein
MRPDDRSRANSRGLMRRVRLCLRAAASYFYCTVNLLAASDGNAMSLSRRPNAGHGSIESGGDAVNRASLLGVETQSFQVVLSPAAAFHMVLLIW